MVEGAEETKEEGSIDAAVVDANPLVAAVDSKAESREAAAAAAVEEEGDEDEITCFREDAVVAGDDRIEEEGVSTCATNLVEGVMGKAVMVATIATLLLATTTVWESRTLEATVFQTICPPMVLLLGKCPTEHRITAAALPVAMEGAVLLPIPLRRARRLVEDGHTDLFPTTARTIQLPNFDAVCPKKTNQGKKTPIVAPFFLRLAAVSNEDERRLPLRHPLPQKIRICPNAWPEISIAAATTTAIRPTHPRPKEEDHHHFPLVLPTTAATTTTPRMDQQERTVALLLVETTIAAMMDHHLLSDPTPTIW